MKQLFILSFCFVLTITSKAQKFYTKNGNISFFSKTPVEDIKADNNQVMSVLNTQTGELQFSLLTKGFRFKKALMEEHFNKDYIESDKFPKATFKGNVADISKVNFTKDGNYTTSVTGDLTLHGVTKKITTISTIVIKAGKITGTAKFSVPLADYKINVPKIYQDNIAKNIEISVSCNYDQKL